MSKLINIAVVDDEGNIREQIKELICKHVSERTNVDTYSSGEELLAAQKAYHIIFLDIQMNGMNGMETARMLTQDGNIQRESILIFITAIKEYVFEAFDVAAFHYLLKPLEERKFADVFEKALAEVYKRKKQNAEQIFIKTRNRNLTLKENDVIYIESRGKKVEIYTVKEIIEIYASMNELETQLNKNFYRCHRGYLVNIAFVAEYFKDRILLRNGEGVILSKEKYGEFVKVYMRYLRDGGAIFE